MYKSQALSNHRLFVALLSALLLFTLPTGWAAAEENSHLEWEQDYGNINLIHVKETADGFSLVGTDKSSGNTTNFTYLAKTDAYGELYWNTSVELRGKNGGKLINLLTADSTSDGGYLIGGGVASPEHWRYTSSYHAKLDDSGSVEWVIGGGAGGAGYDTVNDIKQIDDETFMYISSYRLINRGDSDAYIVRSPLNLLGDFGYWPIARGGHNDPVVIAKKFEQLENNNYLVIGSTDSMLKVWRLDSNKSVSWSNHYPELVSYLGAVTAEADGGYTIAGTNEANEVVWIKNDADNNEILRQTLPFHGSVRSLVKAADGGYWFGTTQGLYKTDENGNVQWSHPIDFLAQVIATKDGGAAVVVKGRLLKFKADESTPGQESIRFDSSHYTLTLGQTLDTVVKARNGSTVTDVTYQASFSSDDDSIVSIDQLGNITGLQPGNTQIRATWNGIEATANVIVFNTYTNLQLDDTEYSVNIGQPLDLVVTYQEGANFTNVTTSSNYSTSDPSIAIVDQEGNIIGLKKGRTTLTVTYNGVHTTATIDVY